MCSSAAQLERDQIYALSSRTLWFPRICSAGITLFRNTVMAHVTKPLRTDHHHSIQRCLAIQIMASTELIHKLTPTKSNRWRVQPPISPDQYLCGCEIKFGVSPSEINSKSNQNQSLSHFSFSKLKPNYHFHFPFALLSLISESHPN